jgi:hypothetical protein
VPVDSRYNYFECYLTFRCHQGCRYCINSFSSIDRTRIELSGGEWISAINCIEFGRLPLTIGGGEPSLHKDFYLIINSIRSDIQIDLLTNLSFDVEEFVDSVPIGRFSTRTSRGYKRIRVSYHAHNMNPHELVAKAGVIQEAGHSIGIFGISHPEFAGLNAHMAELCRKAQIYFYIKDYLGEFNGKMIGVYRYPDAVCGGLKACECRTNEVLVGPDGKIFRCHKELYQNNNDLGSILNLVPPRIFRKCSSYGSCNPCDIKLKTNRFLQAGQSSCEINLI